MEITIEQLSKVYGNGKRALDDVSLNIHNGMFGLLGPNGAGKSTLMRIMVTLLKPSSGKVTVDNLDLQKNRKELRGMIGYLPQDFSTFPKVKSWEFLDFSARLAGVAHSKRAAAVDEMLEKVGLFDARDRFANKLSGGMKRRLGIAQALIGDPKILVVDEPTTGLDPEERIRFRGILSEMSRKDRIIILSTHIVGDISSTCNDVAVINYGQLAFTGSPEKFVDIARDHTFSTQVDDAGMNRLKEQYSIISSIPNENGWQVEVVSHNGKPPGGKNIEPNLEHAYVYFIESREDEENGK